MDRRRLSGWCGVAFAASVLTINVVENVGTSRPDPSASAEDVAAWASDADALLWAMTIIFPFGTVLLGIFAVGLWVEARSAGHDLFPATLGMLGVAMMLGTLSAAIAADAALISSGGDLDLALIEVLTGFSTTLFLVNWAVMSLALFGLSRTAAALGYLPRWLDRTALIGAVLLLVGATQSAAVLDGTLVGLLPGLAGFAIWLLFLLVAGVRVARSGASRPEPVGEVIPDAVVPV